MTNYRISGVWKTGGVITHYAFHTVSSKSISRASKITKIYAIKLLEAPGNKAYTWIWNYSEANWNIGEKVEVVKGANGKYLRTNPDTKLTNNLEHLIDYNWIA